MTLESTDDKTDYSRCHPLPFELNEADVSKWLTDLPIVDGKRSGELVLSALKGLNKLDLKAVLRLELLELFRPHLTTLDEYFDKQLMDAAFPLSNELDYVARLQIRLHQKLARGFTLVCESKEFKVHAKRKKQYAAFMLQRALISWDQVLFRTSLTYKTLNTEFWRCVYGLVCIAEDYELAEIAVDESRSGLSERYTVQSIFKRILVFVLAHPNRYRQREIEQIYVLTEQFVDHAILRLDIHSAINPADFFIDLSKPGPPQHIRYFKKQESGNLQFLETRPMLENIIKNRRSLTIRPQQGLLRTKPTMRVITAYIRSLVAAEKRRFQRISNESESNLFIGLADLIEALSACSGKSKEQVDQETGICEQVEAANTPESPNGNLHSVKNSQSDKDNNVLSNPPITSKYLLGGMLLDIEFQPQCYDIWEESKGFQPGTTRQIEFTARLVDSSANGHRMVWTDKDNPIVKVGELMGIPGNGSNIEVGAIRWIKTNDKDVLTFGVELFSPRAEVGSIALPNCPETSIKVLLLPEIATCQQPMSVLLRSSVFKAGDWVNLTINGKNKIYRLEELLETTAGFSRLTLYRPNTD